MNEIEVIEQKIKKCEELQIRGEERLKNLRLQYGEIIKQLKELGINPEQAEESLHNMKEELEKTIQSIKSLIPDNLDDFEKLLS